VRMKKSGVPPPRFERQVGGAEGRVAQAESRSRRTALRRDRRRVDLDRQRSLTLQSVERLASVLVLPHPQRETPEVRRLQPNFEPKLPQCAS